MTRDRFDFDAIFGANSPSDATSGTVISGDLGPIVVAGAAGKPSEEIQSSAVTLVTILLDMSTSIATSDLTTAVKEGYNALLDSFISSNEADSMMLALWTFNSAPKVVHSYVPLSEAARLTRKNYHPSGWTTLYDAWCGALVANRTYAEQLRAGGTPCRSIIVVITDGEDNSSTQSMEDCKTLTRALLATERYVLAFVGVGTSDFKTVAEGMGVPPGSVAISASATAEHLRRLFALVSQSAIRVSRTMVMPGRSDLFTWL